MQESADHSSDARLSPFTLRFPQPLEDAFLEHYHETSLRQMRIAILLGGVIFGLFGLLDMITLSSDVIGRVWFLRYAVVCPAVVLVAAFTFAPAWRYLGQLAITGICALAGVVVIVITLITPAPVNYLYTAGLLLIMFYAFTFLRLRFLYALALSFFFVAAYNAIIIPQADLPFFVIANNNFFLGTAIILGGTAGYSIELYIRRNFRQRRIIEMRRAELARKYEELERSNRELRDSRQALVDSSRRAQLIFSALAEALPGTVLENKYQLQEKIGSGAFGTVYRGKHLLLDSAVAVKIFRPVPGKNMEKGLERFRREGMSASRIHHPNAVSVLDFGISGEAIAFLVMELLEGHSLSDELRKYGRLSPRRAAEIVVPILSVLADAHRNAIIHRDIKPSNIFLHKGQGIEVVKVVDFGIAKVLDIDTGDEDTQLTATGALIGTPSYMAPERMGTDAYGVASDVYSVGVVMYEMVTGQLPFAGQTTNYLRAAYMHATGEVAAPSTKTPDLPHELDEIILESMSPQPDERPTAADMAAAIARMFDLPLPGTLGGPVSTTDITVERAKIEIHDKPTEVDLLPEQDTEEM
ncbi:MAG TPA: protein kinase [Thermoanaerobaculia bacterium]|nr:protein kinase [Thermoanaerobaculia bacterium]